MASRSRRPDSPAQPRIASRCSRLVVDPSRGSASASGAAPPPATTSSPMCRERSASTRVRAIARLGTIQRRRRARRSGRAPSASRGVAQPHRARARRDRQRARGRRAASDTRSRRLCSRTGSSGRASPRAHEPKVARRNLEARHVAHARRTPNSMRSSVPSAQLSLCAPALVHDRTRGRHSRRAGCSMSTCGTPSNGGACRWNRYASRSPARRTSCRCR